MMQMSDLASVPRTRRRSAGVLRPLRCSILVLLAWACWPAAAQFSIGSVSNEVTGIFQGGLEMSDLPASDSRGGMSTTVSYDPATFTLSVETGGGSGANFWILHAESRFRFRSTGAATGSDAEGGTSSFRLLRVGASLFGSDCACGVNIPTAVFGADGSSCIPIPDAVNCCSYPNQFDPTAALHLQPGEARYLVPMAGSQPDFNSICAVIARGNVIVSPALDFDLELPAGAWEIIVSAGEGASVNVSWSAEVVTGTTDPSVFFWEGFDGDFSDSSNWEPEGVPGQNDLAIFDKEQDYTVTFGNELSSRAWVERGFVNWSAGAYILGGGSAQTPSLVVGNEAAGIAGVALVSGHELGTTSATLGRQANNEGRVVVSAQHGAPAAWNNQGRIVVGESGGGEIVAEPGTRLTTNELILGDLPSANGRVTLLGSGAKDGGGGLFQLGAVAVGREGEGLLTVDQAIATASAAILGVAPAGEGAMTVKTNAFAVIGNLVVGEEGAGHLRIEEQGELFAGPDDTMVVARESGSRGDVIVSGQGSLLWTQANLAVGRAGIGTVLIEDGARLRGKTLFIGSQPGGKGEVTVTGRGLDGTPSTLDMSAVPEQDIYVAAPPTGRAVLQALDGARVTARSIALGFVGESAGIGVIDLAEWEMESVFVGAADLLGEEVPESPLVLRNGTLTTGTLSITPAGALVGGGVVTVTGDEPARIEGTFEPGVAIVAQGDALKQLGPAYGRGRGFDTLRIVGDVICDGSVIKMSVGGEQGGQQDRLIIEGDAAFEDVTVVLEFKYQFAPEEGMTIPLIEVAGDGSVRPANLEFLGLEEGFNFDLEVAGDGSVIQMRALSNGTPTSFPAEDLNEDGQVNAVDVQLVINGALGLTDPLETDVNFDKVTNAVDVQLVINAALGL